MFAGESYSELFNVESRQNLEVCSSLKSCFFTILNQGLRNGGGIAEVMFVTDINDNTYNFYKRILFDLLFFMMINIISLNIIFGIIVDTFAELRTKQRERGKALPLHSMLTLSEWDNQNRCDVCGFEKRLFEKRGQSFQLHKKVHHNI